MLPLPLLDAESTDIHIDGLDKLAGSGFDSVAMMGELIGLVFVFMMFATPIIIVFAILANRSKRQRMINETVLKLAENGQPIPPELFAQSIRINQKSDLKSAVRWMTIGLAIMGFFFFVGARPGMGIGFIPLMIGVGYYVSWKFEQGNKQP